MKYLAALSLFLGLAVFQTTVNSTTNTIGARQCVECVYWGGNWCPNGTNSKLTSSNGGCSSTQISTCSANYALAASQCVQVSGHATKAICSQSLNLASDAANSTRTINWSQNLAAGSYCQLDLAISGNNNASVSYTFTPTGGSLVAESAADANFTTYISNSTNTARAGSIGTGVMGSGKNSSVSLLMWNQGTASSNVTGTLTVTIGAPTTSTTGTTSGTSITTNAMLVKVTSFIVAILAVLAL